MSIRYDWTAEQVKFAPQVYFFSRTVGALLGAFLLTRIAGVRYFKVNILACILMLVLLIGIQNPAVSLLCIGGVGFLLRLYFLSFIRWHFKSVLQNESDFWINADGCSRRRSGNPCYWVCNRQCRNYSWGYCHFALCIVSHLLCFCGKRTQEWGADSFIIN